MKISEGKCVRASPSLSHILWVLIQLLAARNWGKSCSMVPTTLSKLKLALFIVPLWYLFSFPLKAVKRWSTKIFQCPQQDLKTPHAKHFPDPAGCQSMNEIDNQSNNARKGEYFQKKLSDCACFLTAVRRLIASASECATPWLQPWKVILL